jgi:ornithine carbamoyltransferase
VKNFINIKDISAKDLKKIIFDTKKRKAKRKKLNYLDPDKDAPLKGRFLIQMFEKSSTRTRLSFYLAIRQLGGGALNLRKDELHFGEGGESIHDTAKILSNYGDIFMFRTDSDKKLQEFKRYIKIPIINGLSPSSHPTQILSDIFTIEEIKKQSVHNLNICWIGDSNNVLNSLIEASVKFSFNLKIGCPKKYEPNKSLINWTKKNQGKIQIFNDPKKAISNSDVVFADKFIGIYDKKNKKKKIKDFKNFQVNSKLMSCAKKNAIFLHCLPASRGQEVSAEVIDGKQSKVWQQALNRLHVQKSILLYCLEKLR